jgi:hypothetical protein
MPRFVILRHELPEEARRNSHWDFMLEHAGTLATWALEQAPLSGASYPARKLPDHRLTYLEYEGPISDGRGSVTRWDEGSYETVSRGEDAWTVDLKGNRLTGTVTIEPRGSLPGGEEWVISFGADSERS